MPFQILPLNIIATDVPQTVRSLQASRNAFHELEAEPVSWKTFSVPMN